MQEEVKVMFELLAEHVMVIIVTNCKKYNTTQKEIVPFTITCGAFELQLCKFYSYILHILSSHYYWLRTPPQWNNMIV